ncbi:HD-GYP domain-containing protein [Candidatus Acetothermia bacterium]|nr:HD-GYP domain-containing protein [Candidatus Acetothermia bacterium]
MRHKESFSDIIIQASPAFFVAIDADGKTMLMNKAMLNALGYTRDEVVGKDYLTNFVPKSDRAMLSQIFDKLVKSHESTVNENRILTKDGRKLLVEWHGQPVFKENGEFDFFFGMGVDITERKRAEAALKRSFLNMAKTVSRVFTLRDPFIATHQEGTAILTRAVGEKMDLAADKLETLYIGSLLHDIGKISIPAAILRKPGKLTAEEWGIMLTHPQQGYEVLKRADLAWPVAELALHHHERLDGSGYPDGLQSDELILEVRILAVCNVVDAMSALRPYRPARSKEEIIDEIKDGKGKKYDPDVVDVLLKMIEKDELKLTGFKEVNG